MEESTVYQLIIEKGEARGEANGARRSLLALGARAIGRPTKKALSAIQKIKEADRLVRMSQAVLDVKTWDELLAIE